MGITFADEWSMPETEPRPISYSDRTALEQAILEKYPKPLPVAPPQEDDFDKEGNGIPIEPKKRRSRLPTKGGKLHADQS